mmetsp:Transcript_24674/g.53626  ORF Transcript_24674/g.53626 Transcript_24674/m.53626 type:complete len:99 (+) Transcript_24674:1648-1944(+)
MGSPLESVMSDRRFFGPSSGARWPLCGEGCGEGFGEVFGEVLGGDAAAAAAAGAGAAGAGAAFGAASHWDMSKTDSERLAWPRGLVAWPDFLPAASSL